MENINRNFTAEEIQMILSSKVMESKMLSIRNKYLNYKLSEEEIEEITNVNRLVKEMNIVRDLAEFEEDDAILTERKRRITVGNKSMIYNFNTITNDIVKYEKCDIDGITSIVICKSNDWCFKKITEDGFEIILGIGEGQVSDIIISKDDRYAYSYIKFNGKVMEDQFTATRLNKQLTNDFISDKITITDYSRNCKETKENDLTISTEHIKTNEEDTVTTILFNNLDVDITGYRSISNLGDQLNMHVIYVDGNNTDTLDFPKLITYDDNNNVISVYEYDNTYANIDTSDMEIIEEK